jgi:hypothetical protein
VATVAPVVTETVVIAARVVVETVIAARAANAPKAAKAVIRTTCRIS